MPEQTAISIVQVVGDGVCVSSDDGEKVYRQILEALETGHSVALSFAGVDDLTTVFLNAAVGQLYGRFEEDELRARLAVVEASDQDLVTLKHSVDRAKEYFKEEKRFIDATNEVLGEDDDSGT